MKRKVLSLVMVMVMVFSAVQVMAQSIAYASNSTEEALYHFNSIDFGREVEFFFLEADERSQSNTDTILHFDTMEEFIKFTWEAIAFIESMENPVTICHNFYYGEIGITPFAGNTFHRHREWVPTPASIWTWLEVNFTTENFSDGLPFRAHVVSSHLQGFSIGLDWQHVLGEARTWVSTINRTARVEMEVHGNWFVTVIIGDSGVPGTLRAPGLWRPTVHF
ncbi:MAG: hypothetical protein FWE21_00685 [Defluviitaleaceae bacterium]|nr:hypothetical protein [Defluviitaleaceae bacterium]